jgi:U3 small nucleolar RNA-associated protein 12
LAVSNQGSFVITGSHDKSLRIWEKTDEPLFLEEEREKELEQLYDANLADGLNRDPGESGLDADGVEGDEVESTSRRPRR